MSHCIFISTFRTRGYCEFCIMIYLPAREKLLQEQKNLLGHVEKKLVSTYRNLIKLCDAVAQKNSKWIQNLCLGYLNIEWSCSTCYRTGVSVRGKLSCSVILKRAITPIVRNSFAPRCFVVLNTTLWYRCRTGQFRETLAISMTSPVII